jgi:hypothetical protein
MINMTKKKQRNVLAKFLRGMLLIGFVESQYLAKEYIKDNTFVLDVSKVMDSLVKKGVLTNTDVGITQDEIGYCYVTYEAYCKRYNNYYYWSK